MKKNRNLIISAVCALGIVIFSQSVVAKTNQNSVAVKTDKQHETAALLLQQRIEKLTGFTSQFLQTVTDSEGIVVQQSSGDLSLLQPNQFFWHTKQPEESQLICDGESIWFYDPFIEQVTAFNFKDAVKDNPILLLLEVEANHWRNYQVTQHNADHFTVNVLNEDALIGSIEISFTHNTEFETQVSRLKIYDRQGQISDYELVNFIEKNDFPIDFYNFKLTDGVTLDDQR